MQTDALLDRFLALIAPLSPAAVWAHGSLAAGDYQEGRSDLDLIAVLEGPLRPRTAWRLALLHAGLRTAPLAGDFWRPAVERPHLWRQDVWVDLGLLTFARATVTLREGRLITKREALGELLRLQAPGEVVEDVGRRRYERPAPAGEEWTARRGELTRAYLGPAIDTLVASYA
ncbi:hypothetical protein TU94_08205 [Streptomyces cyaneogriseus subsp. noncyanogenus]|uniref:Polymerase nucleotidyl transferase domain-containing protein n=1 Tax=Streptomyces cyaneogriseus subsp. noncyanogenus TaxID=477245 RepID=A0A0C5GBE2_9ACTN|nr:nucleotidyltransferase domain-containing protein [Streptomyces cyaneogriseus]AJP01476.1 hypothetical protein TU94_08205 [Streptomyces cyaneogriseus subsp. noncyanogenus]